MIRAREHAPEDALGAGAAKSGAGPATVLDP